MRQNYQKSHPWLTFELDLRRFPYELWMLLGECQSNCEHLAGVPLLPKTAEDLNNLFFAKGVRATTAIEGNSLSEEQVLAHLENKLTLPPSKEYLKQEIDNIIRACRLISKEALSGTPASLSVEQLEMYNGSVLESLELSEGVVPGKIRKYSVGVMHYRGAPWEDCPVLLKKLCIWLDGEGFKPRGELNLGLALLKAVVAHLYLAWIHPFGDGNGRTARLVEFQILISSGIPTPAAHLLSNHYNQTREQYYRQLDQASKSGGDVIPFLRYAVEGFRDGIREQLETVRTQQQSVMWENYVNDLLSKETTANAIRRRHLALDLSRYSGLKGCELSSMRVISGRVETAYRGKSDKTLERDLALLVERQLILTTHAPKSGARLYIPNLHSIDAFLPQRKHSQP